MTARPRSDFSGLTLAEVLANERLSRDEASRRAALIVADRASDLAECRELLAMLGLTATAETTETAPGDPGDPGDAGRVSR